MTLPVAVMPGRVCVRPPGAGQRPLRVGGGSVTMSLHQAPPGLNFLCPVPSLTRVQEAQGRQVGAHISPLLHMKK